MAQVHNILKPKWLVKSWKTFIRNFNRLIIWVSKILWYKGKAFLMIQILFYLNNAEIICGDRLEHRKSLSPLNPEFFWKANQSAGRTFYQLIYWVIWKEHTSTNFKSCPHISDFQERWAFWLLCTSKLIRGWLQNITKAPC